MKRLSLTLLAALVLSACAQPASSQSAATGSKPATAAAKGDADAVASAAIRAINPAIKIDRIGPAPFPGFREAILEGQVVYVSDDGKYMMQGSVLEVASRRNLTEASMAKMRGQLLKSVPQADRIVFAPPNPKHTVVVLTDVECGYCRKLHSEIAQINKLGIAVEYLAFPRGGIGSPDYQEMVSVWCSPDRRKALTDAKGGKAPTSRNCPSPVMAQYQIGLKMGLEGTPMILTTDGTQLGGYLPPETLLQRLQQWEKDTAAAKAKS